MDVENCMSALANPICKKRCTHDFSFAEVVDIHRRVSAYDSLKEFLRDYHRSVLQSNGELVWKVNGHTLCHGDWHQIHGLSISMSARVRRETVPKQLDNIKAANPDPTDQSQVYVITKAWIGQYLETLCDQSPIDAEYYMPPGMTKQLLYNNYVTEITQLAFGVTPFTYDRFCKVFKIEYPRVHKAKDTYLAKCNLCVRWADPKTKKISPEDYKALQRQYVDHLKMQAVSQHIFYII